MKNEIVFGRWESFCFLISMIGARVFLNFPRTVAEVAGTTGWIMVIYTTILVLIVFFLITRLYEPFEGKDLIDISEMALGGIGRIIVGIILLAYILLSLPIFLREFAEDMKTISYVMSPISFILILLILGTVIAAYFGLEAIVRTAAIFVPVIIVGFLIIFAGVIPYFNFNNLFPIFGNGWSNIAISGISQMSIFSPVIWLFFITPYIKTNKNLKVVGYSTLGSAGLAFVTSALVYILVYPYPVALENFLPLFHLARLINIGRFFQRIESMFVFIWAAGALLHLSSGFYLLVHIFRKIFKLKYQKPLIIPLAILIFNLSLLPSNLMEVITLESRIIGEYSWIFGFGIPVLVLLISRTRKKAKGAVKSNER